MGPAAPFLVVTRAGEIGQNLPHQLSADGKEMRTILKVDVASIDQPHINLSGRCEVCPRAAPTQWRTQLAAPILNSTRPNTKVSPITMVQLIRRRSPGVIRPIADSVGRPTLQRKDGMNMPKATWKPHEKHLRLTTQSDLPDGVYAFPKHRKEPLTDAQHVQRGRAVRSSHRRLRCRPCFGVREYRESCKLLRRQPCRNVMARPMHSSS